MPGSIGSPSAFTVRMSYTAPASIPSVVDIFSPANAVVNTTTFQEQTDNDHASVNYWLVIRAELSITVYGDTPVTAGDIVVSSGALVQHEYDMSVCNAGPAFAQNVSASWTIPSQFTLIGTITQLFVDPSVTCVQSGLTFTCSGFSIPPPVSATAPSCRLFALRAVFLSDCVGAFGEIVQMTGVVSAATLENDYTNNNDKFAISILSRADIRVTKSGTVLIAAGETTGFYSFKIVNGGPSMAFNVRMTDFDIPQQFSVVAWSIDFPPNGQPPGTFCTIHSPHNVSCFLGNLGPITGDDQVDIIFNYTVPANTPPTLPSPFNLGPDGNFVNGPNNLTNIAYVTSDGTVETDPSPDNNHDPHFVDIYALTDVQILKDCLRGDIISGSGATFNYVLTVRNGGISDAKNVRVLDVIPTEFAVAAGALVTVGNVIPGISVVCQPLNVAKPVIDCSVTTLLPFSASRAFTLTVTVSAKAGATIDGTVVTNFANVTTTSYEPAATTWNNFANCSTVIRTPPDVVIRKLAPQTILINNAATIYSYIIILTNNGPTDATNVALKDDVDARFVVRTSEISFIGGYASNSCVASLNNKVDCVFLGTLAVGASITVTIPFNVPLDRTAGTVVNCANVSAQMEIITGLDNNRACNSTILTNTAKLDVVPTASALCAGTSTVTSVQIINNGAAPADNVVWTTTLPSPLQNPIVTQVNRVGGGSTNVNQCSVSGSTITCNFLTLVGGGSVTVFYSFSVPASQYFATSVSVSSQVTTTTPQSSIGGNTNSALVTINECADVKIIKTGEVKVVAGTSQETAISAPYRYVLTVSSIGSTNAFNVTVSDVLPLFFTATSVTPGPSICSIVPFTNATGTFSRVNCFFPGLWNPTTDRVITVFFSVSSDAPRGVVENCATVANTVLETDYTNNVNCTTTTVITQADVRAEKTKSADCIIADGSNRGSFVITVNNRGPSRSYGVAVTDLVRTPFVFVPGSLTYAGSELANAPQLCSFNDVTKQISCPNLGNLPPASLGSANQIVITFQVTVPSSTQTTSQVNEAVVTSQCSPGLACVTNSQDPDPSNNRPSVTQCINIYANLNIKKFCPAGSIVSGKPGPYFFTIQVDNLAGPADAYNVEIVDVINTNYFKNLAIVTGLTSAPLNSVCALSLNVLRCSGLTFVKGYSGQIVLSFAPVAGFVTTQIAPNSANITSSTSDSDTGNNVDSCDTTIVPPPDVGVTKTGPYSILIDDVATPYPYEIIVTNYGLGVAEAVTLNDTIPEPLNALWGTLSVTGAPNRCVTSGRNLFCELGDLAQNAVVVIRFQFQVPQTDKPSVTNCVTIALPLEIATGGANNFFCNTTLLSNGANLGVTKFSDNLCAGASGVYSIHVKNLGPATARVVTVADFLSNNFTNVVVTSITSSVAPFVRSTSLCSVDAFHVLRCPNLGNLVVSEQVDIVFSYFVPSTVRATAIVNKVDVSSSTVDLITSDNSFTVSNFVSECATITPYKTGDGVVVAGSPNTYSYVVTFNNTGVSAASAGTVTLSDTFPSSGFVLQPASLPSYCVPGHVGGSFPAGFDTVLCTFPNLILPGQSQSVTLFFKVCALLFFFFFLNEKFNGLFYFCFRLFIYLFPVFSSL
jgi:uncharacterized repeat protein (TIGR01451 family)